MEELLSPADQDGAEPTANSVTVTNLLRAASYSGHTDWVEKAGQILAAFSERLQKIPIALPEMARATALFHHTLKQVWAGAPVSPTGPAPGRGPGGGVGAVTALCFLPPATHALPGQVVICGDPQGEDTKEMLRCVHSVFSPNKVEVPALPALPWPPAQPLPASHHHAPCCRLHCWCLHPFSQCGCSIHSPPPPLSCFPSGKHPILSIFISADSRAMAEPLHPSPWHRALAAQPRQRLQQRLLLLPAVYTALSLSPASPALLSQGKTFRSGADVSCPVWMCHAWCRSSQCLGHLPGATLASLGSSKAIPRSGCGYPRPGGVGFSQKLCPQLCCRCALGLPPCSAHLHPRSEMRHSVHPTEGPSCLGAGAVCCPRSWQGRAAWQLVPITFGGQCPCPGDSWLLPWQSCRAEGSRAGLRARGLSVSASGPDSSLRVRVLVPGTCTLSHSMWGAGTEAKAPVSFCKRSWGELGRAEPSARDPLLCPHISSAHGGFHP